MRTLNQVPLPLLAFLSLILQPFGSHSYSSSRQARRNHQSGAKVWSNKPVASPQTLSSSTLDWKLPPLLPKVIVFDLDNTLWTPELYQIRKRPTPEKDIRLFPNVPAILKILQQTTDITVAIASRTSHGDWARYLLDEMQVSEDESLGSFFPIIEIQTGSKKVHMANIRDATKVKYRDMILFDDALALNCKEIAQLGVMCGHCPKGITLELVQKTLDEYDKLKSQEDSWMGEIIK